MLSANAALASSAIGLRDLAPSAAGVVPVSLATQALLALPRKPKRVIPRTPFRVLDAPGLPDDFYLNVIAWSSQNVMAVGLQSDLYLWNGATENVTLLSSFVDPEGTRVCSVRFSEGGEHISVGLSSGDVQIWDVNAQRKLRTLTGHTLRASSQAWGGPLLATGGKDKRLFLRDVRARDSIVQSIENAHAGELCGLEWSPDRTMLASGGNDNHLRIWSISALNGGSAYRSGGNASEKASMTSMLDFTHHKGSVKGMAWSPHQSGVIASGGGTHDRSLRFFSTLTGGQLASIDTQSQITAVLWSPNVNEVATAHGFNHNCLCVWKYPSLTKVVSLPGAAASRILFAALGPDGEVIVTGAPAPDETLRFWRAFPPSAPRYALGDEESLGHNNISIGGGSAGELPLTGIFASVHIHEDSARDISRRTSTQPHRSSNAENEAEIRPGFATAGDGHFEYLDEHMVNDDGFSPGDDAPFFDDAEPGHPTGHRHRAQRAVDRDGDISDSGSVQFVEDDYDGGDSDGEAYADGRRSGSTAATRTTGGGGGADRPLMNALLSSMASLRSMR
jgi:cell division cycle 20-like protein 1 (cofactor of APC complex)